MQGIFRTAACAVAVLAAGCGGESTDDVALPKADVAKAVAKTSPAAARPRRCVAGSHRLGSERLAYAAVVKTRARAYRALGRQPIAMLERENVNDYPMVLGVLAAVVDARCKPQWYRVQLPQRPNGVQGFVRARDVDVATVDTRIVVDLSARRVTLLRRGRPVVHARAAIGSNATPTPTGRYYVNQRLVPEDKSGPFGPGAIGISAFSNVLTGWTQGGPIAIHGTNDPSSIGRAVSNGCIRLHNRMLTRIFEATPAGTPVIIRA